MGSATSTLTICMNMARDRVVPWVQIVGQSELFLIKKYYKRILIEKTFRYLLCNQRTQKCVAKVKIGGNCQGFGPGFNDIEKNCRYKILLQQKKSKFLKNIRILKMRMFILHADSF